MSHTTPHSSRNSLEPTFREGSRGVERDEILLRESPPDKEHTFNIRLANVAGPSST